MITTVKKSFSLTLFSNNEDLKTNYNIIIKKTASHVFLVSPILLFLTCLRAFWKRFNCSNSFTFNKQII